METDTPTQLDTQRELRASYQEVLRRQDTGVRSWDDTVECDSASIEQRGYLSLMLNINAHGWLG